MLRSTAVRMRRSSPGAACSWLACSSVRARESLLGLKVPCLQISSSRHASKINDEQKAPYTRTFTAGGGIAGANWTAVMQNHRACAVLCHTCMCSKQQLLQGPQ